MAIQIQGTTVIDDNRFISGAVGVNSNTFGFSTYCKSNMVTLGDNNLNIGSPVASIYQTKLTSPTTFSITYNNTSVSSTSSGFIEQLVLILDVASGGSVTWGNYVLWSSTPPTLKANNRYFVTLTRVYFTSNALNYNSKYCAAISQAYSTQIV